MNGNISRCTASVDDEELMQLLDGELGPETAERLRSHFAECSACNLRIEVLARRSAILSRRFHTYDHGFPRASRPGRRLHLYPATAARAHAWARAAVLLLFLGGSLVLVPAVRAWIADLVDGGSRAPTERVASVHRGTSTPSHKPGTTIAYAVEGPVLVVEIAQVQRLGTLELRTTRQQQASAQMLGEFGGERFLVLPGSLEIQNSTASTASYRIGVPRGVRSVRVRVANELLLSVSVDTLKGTARWPIGLTGSGPRS